MKCELTGVNYIPREDGTYIDFNDLSKEEQTKVSDKLTTRLMETLGYTKVETERKAGAT